MDCKLKKLYREFYKQAFIPIFVKDGRDARIQVEACVKAGFKIIEFTQRREDLIEMLAWIKKEYPELYVLAGSTIDNDAIVNSQKRHYPQLLTLDELADSGVDGFVSMLKFSDSTIKKYCDRYLMIPCASTLNEAYDLLSSGAHFIKIIGPDLDLLGKISSAPLFKFCPVFITGGMNLEKIPQVMNSGAVMVASGFDLILKDINEINVDSICEAVKAYQKKAIESRSVAYPEFSKALYCCENDEWIEKLPHYSGFGVNNEC